MDKTMDGMAFFDRMDRIGQAVVPENRGEDPPTFKCSDCSDVGFLSRQLPDGARARWCDCDRGIGMEAGYWFARIYPLRGNSRRTDHGEKETFRKYAKANGLRGHKVREAVRHLRLRELDDRSRKMDDMED